MKENMGLEPASHDKGIQYTFAAQLTVLLKRLQTLMHNTYAHWQILKEPSLKSSIDLLALFNLHLNHNTTLDLVIIPVATNVI